MAELLLQPDEYSPITNAVGEYEDRCPTVQEFRESGIRCPCQSRKQWVFLNRASFRTHLSCAAHKRWLAELNQSKFNFYRENIELRQLVAEQKIIIARVERDNSRLRGELFRMIPVDTFVPLVPNTSVGSNTIVKPAIDESIVSLLDIFS